MASTNINYKARKDMQGINNETENNTHSEQMLLPALFFKTMTGDLLPGATVVTKTPSHVIDQS